MTAKNCVAQKCTTSGFQGTFPGACTNNVSDDGTAPGSNPINGPVKFVGASVGDFRLANSDRTARGAGIDLSGTFTTDITGQTRAAWDCGADEYAKSKQRFVSGEQYLITRR